MSTSVSHCAKKLLGRLKDGLTKDDYDIEELSAETGLSKSALRRALAELEAAGYIDIHEEV